MVAEAIIAILASLRETKWFAFQGLTLCISTRPRVFSPGVFGCSRGHLSRAPVLIYHAQRQVQACLTMMEAMTWTTSSQTSRTVSAS